MKRLISSVLAAALAAGMLTITAFAANELGGSDYSNVSATLSGQTGDTGKTATATISSAINAITAGTLSVTTNATTVNVQSASITAAAATSPATITLTYSIPASAALGAYGPETVVLSDGTGAGSNSVTLAVSGHIGANQSLSGSPVTTAPGASGFFTVALPANTLGAGTLNVTDSTTGLTAGATTASLTGTTLRIDYTVAPSATAVTGTIVVDDGVDTFTITPNITVSGGTPSPSTPANLGASYTGGNAKAANVSGTAATASTATASVSVAAPTAAGSLNVSSSGGYSWFTVTNPQVDALGKVTFTYNISSAAPAAGTYSPTVQLTDGSGNTLEVKMNITLTASVPTPSTTGTASGKITGIVGNSNAQLGSYGAKLSGMRSNVTTLSNLDIGPDAEIQLWLRASQFTWEAGATNVSSTDKVTKSQLSNGKITVKKSVSKGSNCIDAVEFDSDTANGAFVKIKFVEYFVSVKEQDIDFKAYLAYKGSKEGYSEINIAGEMKNNEEEVDEGDDYVSGEDGTVIEAQAYVRNIKFYMGNGVTAHLNLFKDKKYYGVALNDPNSADDAILSKHPEIDNVVSLKTVNVKGSGNMISFDMDGSYHVYGADGKYLGTSAEKVPYSDKYYFAVKKIHIADDDDNGDDNGDDVVPGDDVIPGGEDLNNPGGGGDSGADNVNLNPGTGVNGFVNVAVLAGVISLAAAGVTVARKRKK